MIPVAISKDEYHRVDHEVIGIAFGIHNELGRFCDEKIYQAELAGHCKDMGLDAKREVPIKVSHEDFLKTYFVDLVVDGRVLYEVKTADAITPQHRQQTLNYLFLTGFRYGSLVNMRTASVQREFMGASITTQDRYRLKIAADKWVNVNPNGIWLRQKTMDLLADWGGFLDIQLFYDAISHFRGGDEAVIRSIEVQSHGRALGAQGVYLLSPDVSICISAIKEAQHSYEQHLRRFLAHTSLRATHWINFNRHSITMQTLLK